MASPACSASCQPFLQFHGTEQSSQVVQHSPTRLGTPLSSSRCHTSPRCAWSGKGRPLQRLRHAPPLIILSACLGEKGHGIRKGTKEYERLVREYVPPYDAGKFPNKWRKMWADAPARTLMAHLGKDSYSHIHYDSRQARTISVREAARLQSFPDGFVFAGTMNPAFRQIGNAVPPLLARAIADTMMTAMGRKRREN